MRDETGTAMHFSITGDGEDFAYMFNVGAGRLMVIPDEGVQITEGNPLACPYFDVWQYQHEKGEHDFGCDCGRIPAAMHSELCLVTPIFAAVCRDLGRVRTITEPFIGLALRTVIPRRRTEAECMVCDGNCPDEECPMDDDY